MTFQKISKLNKSADGLDRNRPIFHALRLLHLSIPPPQPLKALRHPGLILQVNTLVGPRPSPPWLTHITSNVVKPSCRAYLVSSAIPCSSSFCINCVRCDSTVLLLTSTIDAMAFVV